jgi:hypothetical protein
VASPTTLTPPPVLDQRLLEPRRHHPRGWLMAAGVVATVTLVAALALNWYGMLPWHGPMSGGLDQVGGVNATVNTQAGHKVSYASLWVYNPSRVAVTLDSVAPVVGDGGLKVVDAWLPADHPICQRLAARWKGVVPDSCKVSLEGYVIPSHTPIGNGPRLVVELRPTHPGTYTSPGFNVRYHVGPIHYTTTYAGGFVLHAS